MIWKHCLQKNLLKMFQFVLNDDVIFLVNHKRFACLCAESQTKQEVEKRNAQESCGRPMTGGREREIVSHFCIIVNQLCANYGPVITVDNYGLCYLTVKSMTLPVSLSLNLSLTFFLILFLLLFVSFCLPFHPHANET